MDMIFFNLLLCCVTLYHVSGGKTILGILGRNVSLTWLLSNIKNDAFLIYHGTSPFLRIWPAEIHFVVLGKKNRVNVSVERSVDERATLTVRLINITQDDAGIYTVARQWNSEVFNVSINLQVIGKSSSLESIVYGSIDCIQMFYTWLNKMVNVVSGEDQSMIPWVGVAQHDISDYSLVLQCYSYNYSTGRIIWRLNESLIQNNSRYYPNDTFLSIRNLTTDDQYNVYTCEEPTRGFESDQYKILISGPNFILFLSNFTVVKEHEELNLSCLSDCYPVCSWRWTHLDPLMSHEKVVSATNILYIKNITRQNAGTYSYKVQNGITGVSLENVTKVDVIYGPDEIMLNITSSVVQLQENDSITILCSADCFPPCQIYWSEQETLFPGAELKLQNVTKDGNYTCHATNTKHGSAKTSDIVHIILKSGTSYEATTTATTGEENKNGFDQPSKLLSVAIILGLGGLLVGVGCTCLVQKSKLCSRAERPSNTIPLTSLSRDGENENFEAVQISQGYWTIVSNAQGELSTALESDFKLLQETTSPGNITVKQMNEEEQIVQLKNISDDTGENDYIHPIHSVEADDIDLLDHTSNV